MQFASRLKVNLNLTDDNLLGQLFAEELGAVIQVLPADVDALQALAKEHGVDGLLTAVGETFTTPAGGAGQDVLTISTDRQNLSFTRAELQKNGRKSAMPSPQCVTILSALIKSLP